MINQLESHVTNLKVIKCPLGCTNGCSKVYENKDTGHKIICECKCHK